MLKIDWTNHFKVLLLQRVGHYLAILNSKLNINANNALNNACSNE